VIAFREATAADAEAITAIWNLSFPSVTVEQYTAQQDHTAAVAVDDGRLVGAIPFQLRPLVLVPGVTATVAWAHSVSTIPGKRNQGLGSGMMATARRFLASRCEAMCVYTDSGGEQPSPYGFYSRSGHVDACYIHRYYLAPADRPMVADVRHLDVDALYRLEPALLEVFASDFGSRGGFWPRGAGFYRRALDSVIYIQDPAAPSVLVAGPETMPNGFAVLGDAGAELQVLELATRDGDMGVAAGLLRHVSALAGARGQTARFDVAANHRYARLALALGWQTAGRARNDLVTAAQVLQPEALAARLLHAEELPDDMELWAWVARRDPIALHVPAGGRGERVMLELKEEQLHKLLLGRLNVGAALTADEVVLRGASDALRDAVARAIPWCAWAYHAIEFI
jgi:GNAT superfamily N-acetyltransferase